jgi:hypothetical protein
MLCGTSVLHGDTTRLTDPRESLLIGKYRQGAFPMLLPSPVKRREADHTAGVRLGIKAT